MLEVQNPQPEGAEQKNGKTVVRDRFVGTDASGQASKSAFGVYYSFQIIATSLELLYIVQSY